MIREIKCCDYCERELDGLDDYIEDDKHIYCDKDCENNHKEELQLYRESLKLLKENK